MEKKMKSKKIREFGKFIAGKLGQIYGQNNDNRYKNND